MDQRGRGRYDRSRYGSDADAHRSARRYRDTFYEDMLISDDDLERSFASHEREVEVVADDQGEPPAREGSPDRADQDYYSEQYGSTRPVDSHRASAPASRQGYESGFDESDAAGYGARFEDADGSNFEVGADVGYDYASENDAAEQPADPSDAESGTERVARTYSRKSVEDRVASKASKKRFSFKLGRVGKAVAIVFAAVVLVGAGVAMAFVSGITGNLHAGVGDDLRAVLVKTDMAKEPFYMVLLGTDGSAERDADPFYGGGYRSDSMMLARLDPVQKKATLISISRDIQVNLGGDYGKQKINAAYAIGGPAMAVQAVSDLAGVPISHYAQVDFDGFSAMVDALGGVEVDVPMPIVDDFDAGGSVPGGLQTLNGEQALILCRARNSYAAVAAHPDEMRAANQRLVLSAIAKKLLGSDIGTIATTVQAMSSYVTTDLELTDIIGLAQIMKGLDPDTDIYTAGVPTTSQYIGDVWYEFVKTDEWNNMMKRVDAGEPPVDEAIVDETTGTVLATAGAGTHSTADKYAVVNVKNATNTQGLAAKLRDKLVENGFVNAVVGDIAEGYDYPETIVVYDTDNQAREAAEIVQVMGQGKAMKNDGSYLLLDSDFVVVIGDDWDPSLS